MRGEDLMWIFHKSQQVKFGQQLDVFKKYLKVHSWVSEWTLGAAASPGIGCLGGAWDFGAAAMARLWGAGRAWTERSDWFPVAATLSIIRHSGSWRQKDCRITIFHRWKATIIISSLSFDSNRSELKNSLDDSTSVVPLLLFLVQHWWAQVKVFLLCAFLGLVLLGCFVSNLAIVLSSVAGQQRGNKGNRSGDVTRPLCGFLGLRSWTTETLGQKIKKYI